MTEQPSAGSANLEVKVAVFDLDETITVKDTYVEFLLFCMRKKPSRYLCFPALVAYYTFHKMGFRSNHWLKAKFLGTVVGGISRVDLQVLSDQFSANVIQSGLKPKALLEIERLRQGGYVLVLATASFDFYVKQLYSALDMDFLLCSLAEFDGNDCLTGAIDGKNCIGEEKGQRVKALMDTHGWECIERSYSDSKADLPLWQMSDTAIVVDPGKSTTAVATKHGFTVVDWR